MVAVNRHPKGPVLTRTDIVSLLPELRDVSSVFNPGGIMYEGRFLLLLRVQNRARETLLVKAVSEDGIRFRVDDAPLPILGLGSCPRTIHHIYDPRITLLEGTYHVLCAVDADRGCYLGWFTTTDFSALHFQGLVSEHESRNGILFPEKFEGRYLRFERPNTHSLEGGVTSGSTIVCAASDDLLAWEEVAPVFSGKPHFWDELIGSGPPPLKTRQGWLHLYHGVATHFSSSNIYQVGVSLQDLNQPWLTLARGRYNILEPREIYELTGQVPNVVFPTAASPLQTYGEGFVDSDTPIHVYYGAADTCVGLALTTVKELLEDVYA
jgi:beta-1,4-mannooligosaccharide/beta-1,4-mannosyl-N-acetylglucosamine phosphorylase